MSEDKRKVIITKRSKAFSVFYHDKFLGWRTATFSESGYGLGDINFHLDYWDRRGRDVTVKKETEQKKGKACLDSSKKKEIGKKTKAKNFKKHSHK